MSKKTNPNNLEILRHSASHVLAAAVLEMFPEAKFGTGPAIENGFYYDFELPRTLIPEDLPLLEEKMKKVISQNYKFEKADISIEEALNKFKEADQPYKIELINELKKEGKDRVSVYKTGNFVDLCSGPHLDSTGEIDMQAVKLTKISGAYWKSDEKNKMLQRICGIAFEKAEEMDKYLDMIGKAIDRDHKKLGRDLDLFSFHSEAPGSAFWHPKGMIIWNELEKLGKSLRKKYGCMEIQTPILAKTALWKTSGHWEHYKDSMFHFKTDNDEYAIKPMDCPFNIKLYQEKQHSYRELPIRFSEIGRVMRNEKSGELNGLLRVQHVTQDDAHIFCREDQVESEIITLLQAVKEYYTYFKIEPRFFFANRPKDFMGEIETWEKAEHALKNALNTENIKYDIKDKDGAFYGPKIDININDALGRSWQLATIQLDFQLPERFGLEYIDSDSAKKRPVIIHAAIFGSFERFIGILTEHFAGAFPLWLSPVQTIIIPISEKFKDYAQKVKTSFSKAGIRTELNDSDESLGKRIREAELQKIPYIIILGQREKEANSLVYRMFNKEAEASKPKMGELVPVDEFIKRLKREIDEKK